MRAASGPLTDRGIEMGMFDELRYFVRPWSPLDACYLLWAINQDGYDMPRIARALDRTPGSCEHFLSVLCKDEYWKQFAVPRASTKAEPARAVDFKPSRQAVPYSVPNDTHQEIISGRV